MISTNQIAYFKRSTVNFFKMTKVVFAYFQSHKSNAGLDTIIGIEHISNGELSDPLCDSVNRGIDF